MAKIAFVLIYVVLAAAGRQTSSAHLRTQENDDSKSLANALNEASASIIQPNERYLMRRDSESGATNVGTSKMLPETQPCYSGYWWDGVCTPCPKGTYSESGVNVCVPCEPGYYNDQEGQYRCTPCASFDIAPYPGSTVCTPCSIYAYTPDNIICIDRPTHPTSPPSESSDCRSGHVYYQNSCVPCSQGLYYVPNSPAALAGDGSCYSCVPGTFSDEEASTQCKSCPPGAVAPGYASTSCSSCPALSNTVDGITCIDSIAPTSPPTCGYPTGPPTLPPAAVICDTGYENNGVSCEPCRPGSYGSYAGVCVPCAAGTVSHRLASVECYPCGSGEIAPDPGMYTCQSCPVPSYSVDGITCIDSVVPTSPPTCGYPTGPPTLPPAAVICDTGYENNGVSCEPCRPGSYGSYAGVCVPCAAGTVSHRLASVECYPCGSGEIAPDPGMYTCQSCPVPSYSVDGITCIDSVVPTSPPTCGYPTGPPTLPPAAVICDTGYENNGVSCEPCRPGSYGSYAGVCVPCAAGTVSHRLASVECYPCGSGGIAPDPGMYTCQSCPVPSYSVDGITCIDSVVPTSPPTCGYPTGPPTLPPVAVICDTGYENNGVSCEPCRPGSYWSFTGVCVPCAAGTVSHRLASVECYPCGSGEIAPDPGMYTCQSCPVPSYSVDGITCIDSVVPTSPPTCGYPTGPPTLPPVAVICDTGYENNGVSCEPCRPGSYWSFTGVCVPCAAGTVSHRLASVECYPCGSGEIAPDPGMYTCQSCPVPSYSVDGITCIDSVVPTSPPTCGYPTGPPTLPPVAVICDTGYENNGVSCEPCRPGSYGSYAGVCVPCAAGTVSHRLASVECYPCGSGGIAPDPGMYTCQSCPVPSYSVDGITCIDSVVPTGPPTDVIICPAGSIRNVSGCVECDSGTYEEAGSCIPCKSGTSMFWPGATQCFPCSSYAIAPQPGSKFCYHCPEPAYSQDGITCTSPPPTLSPTPLI